MLALIDVVLLAALAAAAVPVSVFAAQILASLPRRRPGEAPSLERPSIAVLVPAHDEVSTIAVPLAALRAQLKPGDRLLVVADNCTDETAAVAAAAGAEVMRRDDPKRRGKGYALDAGLRQLAETGPREVVVFVDADCVVGPGSVALLASLAHAEYRPIQGAYVLAAAPDAPSTHRLAAFSHMVKTVGRPLGWRRLGCPCHLSGTGMAMPWALAMSVDLASGHITEDLKLGMDLALLGAPPRFCPDAQVDSAFPDSEEGRTAQQTRWEHGHLGLMRSYAPRLLRAAIGRGDIRLLFIALDLCVPPVVSLTAACVGLTGLSALWALATGQLSPLLAAAVVVNAMGLSLLLAAVRWGRGLMGWRDLAALPRFLAGKAAILLRFTRARQTQWVRAERRPSPFIDP